MLDPRLNHVVAVSRFGSFTLAAQSVGVTQSAVTRSIADLERRLGYSLFHRTARGALLTEKGREFVERATRLLHDAHELLDGQRGEGDPFAGALRIGVCPASLEWQLIKPIGRFQKRHPQIRFEITGASFERMIQQLRSGTVDVALGFDEAFREWPDVRRMPIGELRTSLFVRNGHPILAKEKVTISDLSEYGLVSPSDSRPYGAILRGLSESGGERRGGWLHIVDYFPVVREIVLNSDAIGVMSASYAASYHFERRFTALTLDPFSPIPMCCSIRTRWEPTLALKSFISTVRQALSGDSGGSSFT